MSHDLDTVIDTIKATLKESVLRHKTYEDIVQTTAHEPMNLAVANRQAIGTLSLALVQALAEQRARGESDRTGTPTLKVVGTSA